MKFELFARMLRGETHMSQRHGELKKCIILITFSAKQLNLIRGTYGASDCLQRLEIRFVIGVSPVPGLSGKMWLGEK